MERRKVLTWLVHAGSAAVALVVGVPTLMYAVAPGGASDKEKRWVLIGPLSQFPVGQIRASVLQLDETGGQQSLNPGLYVWRLSDEKVIVFSRSCTDLGCPITFDHGSECFFCPCHGGIFSKEGDPMAGPPDRPLYRYEAKVMDGNLYVDPHSVPPMV